MILGLVILSLSFLSEHDGSPREGWTLRRCLERGLDQGLELRERDLAVSGASLAMRLSAFDWMPQVSVAASADFSWGRSVDMQELVIVNNGTNTSSSLSASASLSSSSLISAGLSVRERKSEYDRTLAEREDERTELAIDITQAYLQLLLSYKMCDNARADYDNILVECRRVGREVEEGKASYGSLFEIEAQAAAERETLAEAIGKEKDARITLSGYLNLPPEEKLEVSPPVDEKLPPPAMLPSEACIEARMASHPRTRGAQAARRASRARKKAALCALMPELSLTGYYATGYSNTGKGTFGEQLSTNLNPAVSIGLTIPILTGSGGLVRYRKAEEEISLREIELERCRRDLRAEMERTLSEALGCYEIYKAANDNKDAMEKSFNSNQARFEAGMISGSDYLICRNNFRKAVAMYWQAYYKYLFSLKVVDYRMGLMDPGL